MPAGNEVTRSVGVFSRFSLALPPNGFTSRAGWPAWLSSGWKYPLSTPE